MSWYGWRWEEVVVHALVCLVGLGVLVGIAWMLG
jgi:hypothetical protein